ncbi:hypothetical protein Sgleb_37680 [Streptomyces glebosus]|uniref:Uncharacterized protein n=1 Tax=Streptomyces glebosus TaxID=249580 RepID=A0A640SZT8_9ACTN|nr:hypothetical protein [Streptomyces glebosus]GFE15721.1 hypothetical protein Sgleb_37680 [Streptomyces glebosus]GHG52214.1 hypothetical protein GCM10010513_12370 [Streptomyces glebosus]
MTLLKYNSLFDNVEAYVDARTEDFSAGTPGAVAPAALRDARALVHGPSCDEAAAQAIWRDVLDGAVTDPAPGGTSVLLLVWFAVPRLRRTVRRISRHLPADRADLETEAVQGVLEGVRDVDPVIPGAGESLMRAASHRAWRFARSAVREHTVPDPAVLLRDRTPPSVGGSPDSWVVHITPPGSSEGLAAPLRFSASKQRVEGERLGALAEGIGLRDVVHRARRPRPGRRIGTLTLHPYGSR